MLKKGEQRPADDFGSKPRQPNKLLILSCIVMILAARNQLRLAAGSILLALRWVSNASTDLSALALTKVGGWMLIYAMEKDQGEQ
ncbi:MAG TPA: hypothetical protein VG965_03625 [Patescibacteria group bacterium]|nr:hypothetical protein [Patescibacteria group bacterium]